jgi:hypothetical protein
MGNILQKSTNIYYDIENLEVEKDKKLSFLTYLHKYVSTMFYSEKIWCFVSHHRHIIDITIGNNQIELKPLEHYITTMDLSKKVLLVCEICEIKKYVTLSPSGILYKNLEILYIPVD